MARWAWRKHPPPGAETDLAEAMLDWYCTPLGEVLQTLEAAAVESLLPGLFGYHLAWIGPLPDVAWLEHSPIRHRAVLSPHRIGHGTLQARTRASALPLATDAVDVVVLHHALELDPDPHQVLREAERVLIPEGRVVIVGFNPWSLWGGRRALTPWNDRVPWALTYLRPGRVKDWVRVLGLEVERLDRYFYRPPCVSSALLQRFGFMEPLGGRLWPVFGALYVLVAHKRVSRPTLVGPRWRRRRRIASPGLVGTSNRNPS